MDLAGDKPARATNIRGLLTVLKAAKTQQDQTAQPAKGRGVWLSPKLWHCVVRQLEAQAMEVQLLEQQLSQHQQQSAEVEQQAAVAELAHARNEEALAAKIQRLEAEAAELRQHMHAREDAWAQHKDELVKQADRLMAMVHERQSVLLDNDGLAQQVAAAQRRAVDAERDAAEAHARCVEMQRRLDYATSRVASSAVERDAVAHHTRDLSAALEDARHQAERYRQQLAARSTPAEDLTRDLARLRADNERLVALLGGVPEYRAFAAEVAGASGLHYLPLEECLMQRDMVGDLYPPKLDRPAPDLPGGLATAGGARDPDARLELHLAAEQYHWAPRQALEVGAALMRRMMPALPTSQLMALVAEINKVWRDRERERMAAAAAAHKAELRQLVAAYQQRAPYEAVLAGSKLSDLKRRIKAQAAQAEAAAAKASGARRQAEEDSKVMLHAGLSSITDLGQQVRKLMAKNSKMSRKAAARKAAAADAPRPVCSSCLDLLLLPSSNEATRYIGRALGVQPPPAAEPASRQPQQRPHAQWQQQQQAADAAPWSPEAGKPAAGASTAAAAGPQYLSAGYSDLTTQLRQLPTGTWLSGEGPMGHTAAGQAWGGLPSVASPQAPAPAPGMIGITVVGASPTRLTVTPAGASPAAAAAAATQQAGAWDGSGGGDYATVVIDGRPAPWQAGSVISSLEVEAPSSGQWQQQPQQRMEVHPVQQQQQPQQQPQQQQHVTFTQSEGGSAVLGTANDASSSSLAAWYQHRSHHGELQQQHHHHHLQPSSVGVTSGGGAAAAGASPAPGAAEAQQPAAGGAAAVAAAYGALSAAPLQAGAGHIKIAVRFPRHDVARHAALQR